MTDIVSPYFCPHCGAANSQQDTHCTFCHRSLTQTSPSQALADSSPSLIHGRYEILAELGSGGYSSVYKARDTQQQRLVAIKAITLRNLSAQEMIEATDTFNREWQILNQLQHPQLPRIHDHFNDTEHWYLVVDFMDGQTLEAYMQNHPSGLPVSEVLEIGKQLCEVLDYLHHSKPPVIFRDLKPGNVMRSFTGRFSLIDFGIARHFQPNKRKDTLPLGSPGFASPEQYGKAQTTPRSDLYSLGALLHFLLTGSDPSTQAFHFEPLRLYGEGISELNTLIQRMISPDPQQRPASAQEVREELEFIRRLLRLQTYQSARQHPPTSQPAGASSRQQQQQQQQQQAPTPQKPNRTRRRVIIGLTSTTVLAGVGAGAFWLLSNSNSTNNSPTPTPTRPPAVTQRVVSPDLLYNALLYDNGEIEVISLSGEKTLSRFSTQMNDSSVNLYWSPDSRRIAITGAATCKVWNIFFSGQSIGTHNDSFSITTLALSPDGRYIATGGGDKLSIWEVPDGTDISQQTLGNNLDITHLTWSPDGAFLAFSDQYYYDQSDPWHVTIWDVAAGKRAGQFSSSLTSQVNARKVINHLAWSADNAWMVVADANQIWRFQPHKPTSPGELTSVSELGQLIDLAWSPHSLQLALLYKDDTTTATVEIWDVAHKKLLRQHQLSDNPTTAKKIVWSMDGKSLHLLNSDDTITELATG